MFHLVKIGVLIVWLALDDGLEFGDTLNEKPHFSDFQLVYIPAGLELQFVRGSVRLCVRFEFIWRRSSIWEKKECRRESFCFTREPLKGESGVYCQQMTRKKGRGDEGEGEEGNRRAEGQMRGTRVTVLTDRLMREWLASTWSRSIGLSSLSCLVPFSMPTCSCPFTTLSCNSGFDPETLPSIGSFPIIAPRIHKLYIYYVYACNS